MGQTSDWQPSPIYPDPSIEILDPRFLKYRLFNAAVERLATGLRWGEGPVWLGDQRCLLVSDIPNDRILRWDEETGAASVFRKPSHKANGNTRDRQGGSSPANMADGGSSAPNTMAPSPCWRAITRAAA